jgi:predicted nucleic acid-binding protein
MVLVDSSVWIEYFKGNEKAKSLETLIDLNAVCINDLILAELLPSIRHKKEKELGELILSVSRAPMEVNWDSIINMQTLNLKNGINRVGIGDLIIVQNAIDNGFELFSLDKHFELMSGLHKVKLYRTK